MADIAYFNYHNCLVGIHRGENRAEVDEAYGEGTYESLFPETDGELGEIDE